MRNPKAGDFAPVWTPEQVAEVVRMSEGGTPSHLIAATMAVRTGRPVTGPGIRSLLKRNGHHTPRPPKAPPAPAASAPPPPNPETLYGARRAASQDKAHIKHLLEQLQEARRRQSFLDTLTANAKATPRIMSRETSSGMREMTAVALLSDCHVEEPVDPASVAYRNEYTMPIADTRLTRFFNGIIWNVEHHRASQRLSIRDLTLWLGGDLMSGTIHEDLIDSSALSPSETSLWLLPRLRAGIHLLLDSLQLESLTIPCSFGNHGRTTKKPRIATGYANNFEWLLYHVLAESFKDEPRVNFEVTPSSHQYVEIYDYTLHFHHGDSLQYNGGVGGLGIPLLKAVPQWDSVRYAHYHNIGHFHQLVDYGRAMCNGSLIGYGPFSQHIRAPFEEPAQGLYFVDSKRGKCFVTKLWVGER